MADFAKLVRLLAKEQALQDKILAVLGRERAAIVKLNREQVEELTVEKDSLLAAASEVEKDRRAVLESMGSGPEESVLKVSDVAQMCPDKAVRAQLEALAADLRETVGAVRKLNEQNGLLIRQSLGLIASTIAIMSARPDAALPTYGQKGKLSSEEDPAFVPRSSSFRRSA